MYALFRAQPAGQAVLAGDPYVLLPCRAAAAAPSSGQLYGREDRDPLPSPNPAVKQSQMGEKEGAFEHPEAYPMQVSTAMITCHQQHA